jgi:hypothetical protein
MNFRDELESLYPSLTQFREERSMTEQENHQQQQDTLEREWQLEEALRFFFTSTRWMFRAEDRMRTVCRECGIDPKRIIGE